MRHRRSLRPLSGPAKRLVKGDPTHRRSELSGIPPSEASAAFYHRVGVLFHQANLDYRFVLRGLAEPLQIARYGVGGHFDWPPVTRGVRVAIVAWAYGPSFV